MPRNQIVSILVVAIGSALLSGCGPDVGNRQEISGAVKLKGAPLDSGVIEFRPLGNTSGAEGTTKSGAMILNGTYTIPRESGLFPGKYQVLITSGDGKTPENSDEPPGPTGNIVSKDRIPADYNVRSNKEIEVKSDQPNIFNYDIP